MSARPDTTSTRKDVLTLWCSPAGAAGDESTGPAEMVAADTSGRTIAKLMRGK
jgi:hypothetical protein